PAFGKNGACYGVEARLLQCGQEVMRVSTAVNIGGNVVRYGFLSDFLPEDDTDIACLAKYHIDHVQFYDWSYRHDTLVPPTDEFTDMMGKRNSLPVIRKKIAACHEHGMLAMAYGAVYASSRNFWEDHRDWGLYAGEDKPMIFIGTFYYMDITSLWREHLFKQYIEAVERVGFDGIHMDTYGEPKHALSSMGESRDLEQALPALIADADDAFRKAGHTPHLIFNNVGAWPVQATRNAPQDAVYMELWFPMDRLRHLREAVRMAKPTDKAVVLAAYPAPFRTESSIRALYGELITSFAIALCGATQLFLGEKDAVVTQGYYADYAKLLPWQAAKIKAYQDFFVRYQELLFDPALKDVSLTHCGGDNRGFACDVPYSVEAEPDKLWLTFREDGDRKLIGLINLCGNLEDSWNRGKDKPTLLENIILHILLLKPVQNAWLATPDEELGGASALACKCTQTELGIDAQLVIPRLDTCALVWL
ncbi:MAG: hypothetical protein LLF96_07295, partial [Eubacteriales bacterium]|nr:hypothetical protein [Eubacteriales bacterium]